jgi:nucleoside-diphosphate-sugar epimerase
VSTSQRVLVVHDGSPTSARIVSDLSGPLLTVIPLELSAVDAAVLRTEGDRADAAVFTSTDQRATAGSHELRGLDDLLDAFRGSGKRVVYLSDATVIGDTRLSFGNEDSARSSHAPHPWRVAAEERMERAVAYGVHGIIVRAALVHGRGCGDLLGDLAGHAESSGESVYIGDGLARVSTVHVDDVVTMIGLALEHASQHSTFVASSEEVLSWARIAEIIARDCVRECVVRSLSAAEAAGAHLDSATMSTSNVSRDTSASRRLNWRATGQRLDR